MPDMFDKLLHDLTNKLTAVGGVGWVMLTRVEDAAVLYPLMEEAERALRILSNMKEVASKRQMRESA